VRVEDLLGMPELRLALLTGAAGLGRELRRVCVADPDDPVVTDVVTDVVADVVDPDSGLFGGACVVLGEGWGSEGVDRAGFVRAVAAGGAVALVGRDMTREWVEACGQAGLPLFLAPDALSGARSAEVLAVRVAGTGALGAEQLLRRQRLLLTALAEGADTGDLLELLARELGVACRVVTPAGRVVAAAGPMAGAPARGGEVARAALAVDRLPALVGGETVLPLGRRAALAGYLVCAGDRTADPVVAQTAELLALDAVRRADRLSVERAHAWGLVDQIESGAARDVLPAAVRARLAAAGIDAAATPTVCCAAGDGAGEPLGAAGRLVVDLVESVLETDPAARWVVAQGKAETVVFAAAGVGGEARIVAALRRAARWWAPVLGRERVAVGVSGGPGTGGGSGAGGARPVAGDGSRVGSPTWGAALAEARGARDLAWTRPGRLTIAAGHEIDSYAALLTGLPHPVREAFADRVLGGLRAYEAEHGGDLLGTLAAFLAANGAWPRCASALGVHVSTLHQRMGRVRDLTGRDLFSARDRVDLLLALEAMGPE
jgi:PucR-like helix-turn-helix protein